MEVEDYGRFLLQVFFSTLYLLFYCDKGPTLEEQKQQLMIKDSNEGDFNISGTEIIAFNCKQKIIAVAEKCLKPRMHIYNYDGKRIQMLSNIANISLSDLNFSRDGEWLISLASAPDHRMILWEWKTGKKWVKNILFLTSNRYLLFVDIG